MAKQPQTAGVVVEELVRRSGGRPVLDEVTFSVPEGEVFGLVGPNGSGKTTLLRVLATVLAADEGVVTVNGVSLREDPDGARAVVGYLPDHFGLYDRLTAQEHLEFYAGVHGIPRPLRAPLAGELLELVGLAELGDDDAGTLSRGQRQRLGLARALVHDPPVLLLDEPASGLDPLAQVEMRELIKELRSAGKTVVISSHDLAALADLCTWIGLMDSGRMQLAGPVAKVRARGMERRRVYVEVDVDEPGELASAEARLQLFPGVVEVEVLDGRLELAVDERFSQSELLTFLVGDGKKVRSVYSVDASLPSVLAALMGRPSG